MCRGSCYLLSFVTSLVPSISEAGSQPLCPQEVCEEGTERQASESRALGSLGDRGRPVHHGADIGPTSCSSPHMSPDAQHRGLESQCQRNEHGLERRKADIVYQRESGYRGADRKDDHGVRGMQPAGLVKSLFQRGRG